MFSVLSLFVFFVIFYIDAQYSGDNWGYPYPRVIVVNASSGDVLYPIVGDKFNNFVNGFAAGGDSYGFNAGGFGNGGGGGNYDYGRGGNYDYYGLNQQMPVTIIINATSGKVSYMNRFFPVAGMPGILDLGSPYFGGYNGYAMGGDTWPYRWPRIIVLQEG